MGQGARINETKSTNSARAGQVNGSNLTENISLIAASNVAVGIMVAITANGTVEAPNSADKVDAVIGMSIEDFKSGSYETNAALDNTGTLVSLNVFGGGWVQTETALNVGTSPFIRHTSGTGTVIGAVRNDADSTTAKQNTEFTVRRMSADGKAALVIPKSMLI